MGAGEFSGVGNYFIYLINTVGKKIAGIFIQHEFLPELAGGIPQRKTLLGGVPNRVSRRWE